MLCVSYYCFVKRFTTWVGPAHYSLFILWHSALRSFRVSPLFITHIYNISTSIVHVLSSSRLWLPPVQANDVVSGGAALSDFTRNPAATFTTAVTDRDGNKTIRVVARSPRVRRPSDSPWRLRAGTGKSTRD